MERKEIEKKYKWETEDIFSDDKSWEKAFKELDKKIDFSSFQGKLDQKEIVLSYFTYIAKMGQQLEKLYLYASMKHDEDVRIATYSAYCSKMDSLCTKVSAKSAFFEPELLSQKEEYLQELIGDARFADYDYALKLLLRQKEHILSSEEEKLLALSYEATGGYQDVFSMLDNANLNLPKAMLEGKKVQMTHGLYAVAMHSEDRKTRQNWFKKYYQAYINLSDALTQTYSGNVKKDVFYTRVRGYDSCLSKAMEGEDVSPIVYKNLIESVHTALPQMYRYMALRKKILQLNKMHMYDMHIPLVKNAELKLSFEDAFQVVVKGLAPLGEDYKQLLLKAKQEGWMDVYENTGKRSGAYSNSAYGVHPYVLLNYQQTTSDVFTIAHELGHAMHSYKANGVQPYPKAGYTIFVAEIASTVNEVLLLKYLSRTTQDKNLKLFLLNYFIDMIRTTLFRQTQFSEFEEIAHEKVEKEEPLTKELLCKIYGKLNKKYFGKDVVQDKQIAYEWMRIPHFYNSFYVYKYATGIISAIAIVQKILTEGESAVQRYFQFLSCGGSTSPIEMLKIAGVDLTKKDSFNAAMQEFESTLNEFEMLQDK